MKKLYIFDLDGTLADSLCDLADSVNIVLERHGFPTHDTEKYKYFVGNGALKLIERALPEDKRDTDTIKLIHAEYSKVYAERMLCKTKPYDGIREVLEKLKAKGCLLAVASNKPDDCTVYIVETLFGKGMFHTVHGKREGVPTKPSPDIMYMIMEELGVTPDECIHTGDSNVDVNTAHNAGIECIGCTWGFRTEEELISAGADHIAHIPEDILKY
ncbi:HAD family hydrolase [Ruminococcus albus]|uniref:HAD-superfamily hydrolase, subfamily IA, variant 3 n=1 Tax=Ruminococcus albus (strain ATCC 27210 / DSM 20455 / JCM 14654 / NCDO 2250 / 7) TaxID=697329 RepID=E6UEM6_RUMA7|nr:HAD family hydrolase [Ruminococcus albus]ADU21795.1 HAD-superfamily hydrolase, subfamily IA, variant 3 [Ruminococcus albus 7 = DSM 20455]